MSRLPGFLSRSSLKHAAASRRSGPSDCRGKYGIIGLTSIDRGPRRPGMSPASTDIALAGPVRHFHPASPLKRTRLAALRHRLAADGVVNSSPSPRRRRSTCFALLLAFSPPSMILGDAGSGACISGDLLPRSQLYSACAEFLQNVPSIPQVRAEDAVRPLDRSLSLELPSFRGGARRRPGCRRQFWRRPQVRRSHSPRRIGASSAEHRPRRAIWMSAYRIFQHLAAGEGQCKMTARRQPESSVG